MIDPLICTQCGEPLKFGAFHCEYCGTSFSHSPSPSPKPKESISPSEGVSPSAYISESDPISESVPASMSLSYSLFPSPSWENEPDESDTVLQIERKRIGRFSGEKQMIEIKRREPEEIIEILSEKLMLCMAKSQERKRALEMVDPFEMFTWCPWCKSMQHTTHGHRSDCPYIQALKD